MQHTVVGRFLDVAKAGPDRVAVYSADSSTTYAELAAAAGGIGHLVVAAGARPGARVGLLTGHGAETIAAIMGALLSGCGYVPLDPSYPVPRLAYMLDDADVTVLVTTRRHAALARSLVGERSCAVVLIEDATPTTAMPSAAATIEPDDLAYLRYTSGSTGVPKGWPRATATWRTASATRSRACRSPPATGSACSPRSASMPPSPTSIPPC